MAREDCTEIMAVNEDDPNEDTQSPFIQSLLYGKGVSRQHWRVAETQRQTGKGEVFHGNREAQVCSDCCCGEAAGRLPSSEHLL